MSSAVRGPEGSSLSRRILVTAGSQESVCCNRKGRQEDFRDQHQHGRRRGPWNGARDRGPRHRRYLPNSHRRRLGEGSLRQVIAVPAMSANQGVERASPLHRYLVFEWRRVRGLQLHETLLLKHEIGWLTGDLGQTRVLLRICKPKQST